MEDYGINSLEKKFSINPNDLPCGTIIKTMTEAIIERSFLSSFNEKKVAVKYLDERIAVYEEFLNKKIK